MTEQAQQVLRDATHARLLDLHDLPINRESIHRLVGLKPNRANHKRWFDLVEQYLDEMKHLARARGIYRIDEVVTLEPRQLVLQSGATYRGAVGAFLEHSTHVATFIVTIGSGLERLARRWMRAGKVMQGTIVDAIASESADAAAERLQITVQEWAHAQGLDITPRYSPGYCGMRVDEQRTLFGSMPALPVNVRLTPSCLMTPIKSISGLIGIGPADKVSPGGYPCEACTHPNCMQRRAPVNPKLSRHLDWTLADDNPQTDASAAG